MNDTVIDNQTGARVITAQELDGVRTARTFAFLLDYLIIGILCIPFALIIGILGIPTLGLAWGLYPFLPFVVAGLYTAATMGGDRQATIGMSIMGIQVRRLDGNKIDPILAILHVVLFWFIQGIAVFLPLLISFFSSKKRLLHDILLGTYVGRT